MRFSFEHRFTKAKLALEADSIYDAWMLLQRAVDDHTAYLRVAGPGPSPEAIRAANADAARVLAQAGEAAHRRLRRRHLAEHYKPDALADGGAA